MSSSHLPPLRRGSQNSSSMPSLGQVSPTLRRSSSLANIDATTDRLRNILLTKEVQDTSGGRRATIQGADPGLAPVGEDPDGIISESAVGVAGGAAENGGEADGARVSYAEDAPHNFGEDREKEAFIARICCDSTRIDVRDWVARTYEILKKAPPPADDEELQAKGARRNRKAWSNSAHSVSDTTSVTGTTGALGVAGGSIAATNAPSRKAPSLISAESLIVHPGKKIELLSVEERLRAYLRGQIPELVNHVNSFVAKRAEAVRREVDEELVERHLLQMRRQAVFDGKANFLRWQNSRRIALQKRLDSETPSWILAAVQNWNQKSAMKAREEEVNETDLIFDYLTKRAAHINTDKLATEIPVFKTLHASYSLPTMWRDKYLEMH